MAASATLVREDAVRVLHALLGAAALAVEALAGARRAVPAVGTRP